MLMVVLPAGMAVEGRPVFEHAGEAFLQVNRAGMAMNDEWQGCVQEGMLLLHKLRTWDLACRLADWVPNAVVLRRTSPPVEREEG